jgi:hypothetical protein
VKKVVNKLAANKKLVERIILIINLMDIKKLPGFEDVNFEIATESSLTSALNKGELEVLFSLLDKEFDSDTIQQKLIDYIMIFYKELGLKKVEGYEDIHFHYEEVARLSLRELYEHELIVLYKILEKEYCNKFELSKTYLRDVLRNKAINNQQMDSDSDIEAGALESNKDRNESIGRIYHLLEEMDSVNSYTYKNIYFSNKGVAKRKLNNLSDSDFSLLLSNLESEFLSYRGANESTPEDRILYLVKELGIRSLSGFDHVDFKRLKRSDINYLNTEEIFDLLDQLEAIYEGESLEDINNSINPLEILDKYKDGAIKESTENPKNEAWRKFVPTILKQKISNWRNEKLEIFYDQAKKIMNEELTGTKYYDEVFEFVVELSRIVFEEEPVDVDDDESDFVFNDAVEESIMSLVEMIILPHLEVLDRINNQNGKILFSNLWNKEFTESLKVEVKNRDGWRCVICEAETDLHVHHKIPRQYGGVHHKDNLVTLCASCHGAIETADVKKAFPKCLANYKKQKFRSNRNVVEELSKDKFLLKDEVEKGLDKLLTALNQKNEEDLVQEVIKIMDRLEVIFYD